MIRLILSLMIHLILSLAAFLPFEAQQSQPAKVAPFQVMAESQDQEGGALERAKKRAHGTQPETQPLRREDGSIVLPGEIPKDTSIAAQAVWKGLASSLEEAKPLQSFQLDFFLRQTNPDPEVSQTNDLDLEVWYLAPNFVRAKFESGRTLLRGPKGDYLLDQNEVIRLFGREGKEDQKQLDQMAAIASNFVNLMQPVANLRVISMDSLEKAPTELHASLFEEASKLTWLSIVSPDFYLNVDAVAEQSAGPTLFRGQLGIDPQARVVRLAVVHEKRGNAIVPGSALCVRMSGHRKISGLQVPLKIDLSVIDPLAKPPRFYKQISTELWLNTDSGPLRVRLTPEDFLPPE